ncbi:MAG: GldM family protein [Bacteroidota bacterium]
MRTFHSSALLLLLLLSCVEDKPNEGSGPKPPLAPPVAFNAPPQATLTLDKQYLYVGVDNPVTVWTNGLDNYNISLKTSPGITASGGGRYYLLKAEDLGPADITIMHKGKAISTSTFAVRRIPDPKAYLGNSTSGEMTAENFVQPIRIYSLVNWMEIGAKCKIIGYTVKRISAENERAQNINRGGQFTDKTRALIQKATAGDLYYFINVMAKCPGNKVSRSLNPLVFEIV